MQESTPEGTTFVIVAVRGSGSETASERIDRLVRREGIWGIRAGSFSRNKMRRGAGICFYASETGIVADARIASDPTSDFHPSLGSEGFRWTFRVENVRVYAERPVRLDEAMRSQLEAFRFRDSVAWGWFVQRPNAISAHDFEKLTARSR